MVLLCLLQRNNIEYCANYVQTIRIEREDKSYFKSSCAKIKKLHLFKLKLVITLRITPETSRLKIGML